MNGHSLGEVVRRLREAIGRESGSDAALLDRFAADRDPAAFAALVARYGPLVLGVCRRIVSDSHLAEDLFQAVFLVLARKAESIRKRDAIGSWLYGVAYRLARKARLRLRFAPEPRNVNEVADPVATAAWNDLLVALDRELQRLPDRLRAPLLLCYYEGCTQDEAARRLGWSFGTLRRRLDQARDLLRVRMTARGATLGAGLLATVLATRGARAAMPSYLSRITIDAATAFAAGGRLAGPAGQLAEEGLRMLGVSKVRAGVALAVLVGGLAVGGGALFGVGTDQPPANRERERPEENKTPVAHAPGSPETGLVLRHGGVPFRTGAEIITVLVTPDGKTILTQGVRTVRLWDTVTGQDQGALELPDDGPEFWTASLTPDGKTLVTIRHNGTGQVWDLAGRKLTRSFPLAAPPFDVSGAKCVHSPDGKMIAVVTADGSIRVCDVTTGKEMEQLRNHSDDVSAAVFTRDSKQIAFATPRFTGIKVWDVETGVTMQGHGPGGQGAQKLVFSDDGQTLAAARAAAARVRGAAVNEQPRATIDIIGWGPNARGGYSLGGNSEAERLMAFTPDGKYLLAPDKTSGGRILTQWNLSNQRAIRQYPEHAMPIRAIAFTADGKILITADTGVRFWDWTTGAEVRASADDERCYALTADGKAVVEGSTAGVVRMWDATTGKELHRFDVPRPGADLRAIISGVAVSPDGKYLAAQGFAARDTWDAARGHYVWVWDLPDGKLLYRLSDQPPTRVSGSAMTFSPDGRFLISTKAGANATIWDMATGEEVAPLPGDSPAGAGRGGPDVAPQEPVLAAIRRGRVGSAKVAFSADGKRVMSSDGQWRVNVQYPDQPEKNTAFRIGREIAGAWLRLVFAPDGSRLAVATKDNRGESNEVRVYDTATGKVVRRWHDVPSTPVRLALSTNGIMLAVASETENPTIVVYDVAAGREVKHFTGLHGHAAWLAFAPDGKRVYAASTDTTVLGWEMP